MRGPWGALALAAVLASACLGAPQGSPPATEATTATVPTPTVTTSSYDWRVRLPLHAVSTYVVVKSDKGEGVLLSRESPGEAVSTEKELFLRIVNRTGQFTDATFRVPALGPGALTEYRFPYPADPPYLLTAQCGCAFVWLENYDLAPDVELGDPGFVYYREVNITVKYDATDPGDVAGKLPLSDVHVFEFNASLLHWTFLWGVNLEGNVTLETPSGRELARWEAHGLEVTDGHVSNGSRPLEVGNWTLKLSGYGWFTLHLKLWYVEPGVWAHYGIAAP